MAVAARVQGAVPVAVLWFAALIGGVAVASDRRAAELLILLGLAVIYLIAAVQDERIVVASFAVMIWGDLLANKSFATIGVGPIYIMEGLLALTVVGALVNPVCRARMARSRLPNAALAFMLVVGALDLVRGRHFGVAAAKDSVIAFYAVGLILPAALFNDLESVWRFLRRSLPFIVLGSLALTLQRILGASNEPFSVTPATEAALIASAFIFAVLAPLRFTSRRLAVLTVLALGVLLALSRAVWVGCTLSVLLGWFVASRDRGRLGRIAAVAVMAGTLLVMGSVVEHSKFAPRIAGKLESLAFQQSSESAAPIANSKWRLAVWHQTVHDRILPNLVAGEGFGRSAVAGTPVGDRFNITDPRTQVHNAYLTYLMREGLIGFGGFLVLVGGGLWRTARGARGSTDPWARLLALGIFCSICVYLVDIGLGVIIEGPMGGIPFWLLIGFAYAIPRLGQTSSPQDALSA